MINKIIEIINAGGYPACISPELNILVGVNNLAVITTKGYRIYKRKGLSLNMLPRAVQIFVLYEWNSETVEDFFKSCAEFKKDENFQYNCTFIKTALEIEDWQSLQIFSENACNDNLSGDIKYFIRTHLGDAVQKYRQII